MARKDNKGRNLRVGEYYDEENNRYMFRKMINGKRHTIISDDLVKLRKEEAKLLISIEEGDLIYGDLKKLTLDQYFSIWCQNSAKSGRKATTYMNYKAYYQANVLGKELGMMKISEIKKIHCQRLFNEMIKRGRKKSTLNNMKSCLSLIFSEAQDDGAINRNPCQNIRFNDTGSRRREAIPDEQVMTFMNFIRHDAEFQFYYPFFLVVFNLGLRVGEICGITWDCVDLTKAEVIIEKSLNRYRKEEFGFTNALGSTKSKKSSRILRINDLLVQAFEQQRKLLLSKGIVSPVIPRVDDYGRIVGECSNLVFVQPNGGVMNEPTVLKLIHRIVYRQNHSAGEGEVKLFYFNPHRIRHTYTTLAYEAGADELAIAERLGHESETTTKAVYTHLRGQKKKEQEDKINKIRIC